MREVAERFGRPLRPARRASRARRGRVALLGDPAACVSLLGPPEVPLERLVEWVAAWVERGGRSLGKPTHFEAHRWPLLTAALAAVRDVLGRGVAIPAHPLALTAERKLDERRQVGAHPLLLRRGRGRGRGRRAHHAVRDPRPERGPARARPRAWPWTSLRAGRAQRTGDAAGARWPASAARRRRRVAEAELARGLGYDVGLLSLAALREAEQRRS